MVSTLGSTLDHTLGSGAVREVVRYAVHEAVRVAVGAEGGGLWHWGSKVPFFCAGLAVKGEGGGQLSHLPSSGRSAPAPALPPCHSMKGRGCPVT